MIKLHKTIGKTNNAGFTIIELLVVLVIIGILSTILVLTFSSVQERQRNTDRVNDIKLIQSHLETYYAENAIYPTLDDVNNSSWVETQLKIADPASIRDPSSKVSAPTFSATSAKDIFTYQPTAANGTSACDNKTVACVKYTLTATLEGSSGSYSVKSLN